jgi:hypothetical protein
MGRVQVPRCSSGQVKQIKQDKESKISKEILISCKCILKIIKSLKSKFFTMPTACPVADPDPQTLFATLMIITRLNINIISQFSQVKTFFFTRK